MGSEAILPNIRLSVLDHRTAEELVVELRTKTLGKILTAGS